ncbi:MAG: DUF86 domain-containing protein [Chloroflexi bacterium]|nr:DUF86 domain-containing protein [Chloroflexota bacterium]MBI5714559.1 DUF86 domain-containing protein [Chloroflexota bacterium]
MPSDDLLYAGQMLDTARKAMQFAEGKDRTVYDNDEVLRVALAHLVQVIGEAARLTSLKFRGDHSEIPWAIIVGMRHKVVHEYMNVDEDIVWETVIHDLPDLIQHLEKIVPPEDSDGSGEEKNADQE